MAQQFVVKPALVLDLDGTVRRTKSGQPFIQDCQDIELMPDMEDLIWNFRDADYLIVGCSNQGGVAHGFKTCMQIDMQLDATLQLFKKNPFHIVRQTFHDAKGHVFPYNHRSLCRKPDIGMLVIAEVDAFNEGVVIDWERSMFVGDRPEDEQCAKNAGIKFMHVDAFRAEGRSLLPK